MTDADLEACRVSGSMTSCSNTIYFTTYVLVTGLITLADGWAGEKIVNISASMGIPSINVNNVHGTVYQSIH